MVLPKRTQMEWALQKAQDELEQRICDISAVPTENAAIPPFTLCGFGRVT
jgi:hypothetical protein